MKVLKSLSNSNFRKITTGLQRIDFKIKYAWKGGGEFRDVTKEIMITVKRA
jgi:hypothetical protein